MAAFAILKRCLADCPAIFGKVVPRLDPLRVTLQGSQKQRLTGPEVLLEPFSRLTGLL